MSTELPDPLPHAQTLLDAMPWPAAALDLGGTVRRTNQGWTDAAPVLDDGVAERTLRSVLDGSADRCEVELPSHDDSPHWYLITITPLTHEGRRVGALLTRQEVTERHESEHELRTFLAWAAHDLRTPMRHMAGIPELLDSELGPGLNDQQRRWTASIRAAATYLNTLLDDLLALARSRFVADPPGVVDTRSLLEHRFEVLRDVIGVYAELQSTDLPRLVTDERLFTVLVDNILIYLLKQARTMEGLLVRVSGERAGDVVTLHIDDNGPGWRDEDPRRLLWPPGEDTERATGPAVPLSLATTAARRLGVTLEPTPSELGGSRLTLRVPAAG